MLLSRISLADFTQYPHALLRVRWPLTTTFEHQLSALEPKTLLLLLLCGGVELELLHSTFDVSIPTLLRVRRPLSQTPTIAPFQGVQEVRGARAWSRELVV